MKKSESIGGEAHSLVDASGRIDCSSVLGLASFPGFAELKRSLPERPQLAIFGVDPTASGIQEDWHGGSRRVKK